jgi:hypothetical protein
LSADRRRFLRVACRGAIAELFVQDASLGMYSVEDVSEGGIFLSCPSPVLPLHAKVEVTIVDGHPPARAKAEVVNVVRPGQARPAGYALQLDKGTDDLVESVASQSRPFPPSPAGAQVMAAASGDQPTPRVLIALRSAMLRSALCDSLKAFSVHSVRGTPEEVGDIAVKTVRVALIEMTTVADGRLALQRLHDIAPKARALLYAQKLPDANGRRDLQAAGVDQLVLPPLDPFEVLKRLFTKGGGDLGRLR